jgi:hypothetical protein
MKFGNIARELGYRLSCLGKNTKLFNGHGDDQVMKDSYIAGEFIAANLTNFSVLGDEKIIK